MCLLTEKLMAEILNLEGALVAFEKQSAIEKCENICVRSRVVHASFLELACWRNEVPVQQHSVAKLFEQCADTISENLPSSELDYIVKRLRDRATEIDNFDIEKDLVA